MPTDENPARSPEPTASRPSFGARLWRGLRIGVAAFVVVILVVGLVEQVRAGAALVDVLPVVAVGGALTAFVWWAFPLLAIVVAVVLGDD